MKASVSFIIVFTLALCSTMNVFAQFSGGDGSSGNPLQIKTRADLDTLSLFVIKDIANADAIFCTRSINQF